MVALKADLEQQTAVLESSKVNRLEPLKKWILEANTAQNDVFSDNWLGMKSFLEKVGSNRLLRAQTVTVSFKKPFDLLAETNVTVRNAPIDFSANSVWWSRQGSNLRHPQCHCGSTN